MGGSNIEITCDCDTQTNSWIMEDYEVACGSTIASTFSCGVVEVLFMLCYVSPSKRRISGQMGAGGRGTARTKTFLLQVPLLVLFQKHFKHIFFFSLYRLFFYSWCEVLVLQQLPGPRAKAKELSPPSFRGHA